MRLRLPVQEKARHVPRVDRLAADFAACKDLDRLYELAGLIDAVADEATALRLKELFTVKQEALEQE